MRAVPACVIVGFASALISECNCPDLTEAQKGVESLLGNDTHRACGGLASAANCVK
jgi:hypothetical protein